MAAAPGSRSAVQIRASPAPGAVMRDDTGHAAVTALTFSPPEPGRRRPPAQFSRTRSMCTDNTKQYPPENGGTRPVSSIRSALSLGRSTRGPEAAALRPEFNCSGGGFLKDLRAGEIWRAPHEPGDA